MLFNSTYVILGAKSSKGVFNGVQFDSTTIFYKADLQEGDNFVGEVGESIKWGTSDNFEKIKHLQFPLTADVVLQQVSNGKNSTLILKDLVPQKQTQQAKSGT
ncbi:hypothetical protein [Acinetobacter gerneri]|uniref:Uncharacterized protein n=1 Tax=Acinetobacter gerneri DSM 14967 = CIP 107464 = MTCC 9824 TaxID=1120926 RepID=N8Y8C0_9GAMM|nr:hypothetical protein [Acinetobacter gerneri]ENV33007.1 hypothetical protein F960_02729 [Acinetobacter gerneri DSM 14967 = CIP 107464 = MTCC 9824]EPR81943.1 hypothetical protein L289_3377 [Acinetobacter gerneri DSM 14967 = CIP 107464 = MTCC 9824]